METNGQHNGGGGQAQDKNPFSDAASTFAHFDQDKDQVLSPSEFGALTSALFRNEATATSYAIQDSVLKAMFDVFNTSGSGLINYDEFQQCWELWITKILHPVSALVVIDVQNDFVDGSLAIRNGPLNEDGAEVIDPINGLTSNVKWAHTFFAQDWHPANHISFVNNAGLRQLDPSSPLKDATQVKVLDVAVFEGGIEQILWPAHCVQGSYGAQLHDKLVVPPGSTIVQKGTNPDIDSYSAFWDNGKLSETTLHAELQARGITDVYVCGLAYDFCVGWSVLHALEHGYRTVLIDDATRALDLHRKLGIQKQVRELHGVIVEIGRAHV